MSAKSSKETVTQLNLTFNNSLITLTLLHSGIKNFYEQ